MDYAVEVIADSSEEWCGNRLTFPTIQAAETYAKDLWSRWAAVRSWRVVQIIPKWWMTVRIPVAKSA